LFLTKIVKWSLDLLVGNVSHNTGLLKYCDLDCLKYFYKKIVFALF